MNAPDSWLIVAGAGIRAVSDLTLETISYVRQADIVHYLVTNSIIEEWIIRNSKKTSNLFRFYQIGGHRKAAYEAMTEDVINTSEKKVCVLFYGHPAVFCFPGHEIIRRARRGGINARMLSGISSLDSMFADIGIDPGVYGMQCFEATDFLVHNRRADPRVNLILFQIGVVGDLKFMGRQEHVDGLAYLTERLLTIYKPDDECVIYEGTEFVFCESTIVKSRLIDLPQQKWITPLSTLYIAPSAPSDIDPGVVKRLLLSEEL